MSELYLESRLTRKLPPVDIYTSLSSKSRIESMGLSKANELLLLRKKIDAETALAWNTCSQV